jgi:peptide/nickel transport system permease protein
MAAVGVAEFEFAVAPQSYWGRARRRFFRHRLAAFSLFLLAALFLVGFLAPTFAPYQYDAVNIQALSQAPSWSHPFGTDQEGRDYFSRVLLALGTEARIALVVGAVITLVGTFVGAVAGYFGRWLDNVLMRATDVFLTVPPLVTILVAATYLNITTVYKVAVVIGCLLWMPIARVARSTCLTLREQEYVEAARAMGASDARIIFRHLLPNTVGPVAVSATLMTAAALILEVTIAYLGFGIAAVVRSQTRTPSIGDVMTAARDEGLYHWWGLFFPGLVLVLLIAPICFVGDGLRDALDPTERRNVRPRKRRTRPTLLARARARVPVPEVPWYRVRTAVLRPVRPLFAAGTSARLALEVVFERRAQRRHRVRWLLVEVLVLFVVVAGAATAVYAWKVNPVRSPWRVSATEIENVSRAGGAQTEVSVAVTPKAGLFAASNDTLLRTIRVYSSPARGGWSSGPGPPLGNDACARGDPSVAVAPDGRQYVALIVNAHCLEFDPSPYLVVASRPAAGGTWIVRRVVPPSDEHWDDKPALAVAPDGRVYVVWSRLLTRDTATIVVSSSRDLGRTWSHPKPISLRLEFGQLVNATVAPGGSLYVVGLDSFYGIWVARSPAAGKHFVVRAVATLQDSVASTCVLASFRPIPFQANRCLGPDPSVAMTRNRVYVTFAGGEPYSTDGVTVATLDRGLHVLSRRRIGGTGTTAQFWPASSVDRRSGRLWVCYYDTTGDPSRKQAWFTCTSSLDGRRWRTPVRASAVSSNVEVLWEDSRIYGFGDEIGYGGYTALAAADGVAHPLWIDTRDLGGRRQEIFSARLRAP